jgi:predicted flavoprotein YhiN
VTTNGLDGDVLVLRQDNYTTLIATVTNITGANVVQLNTSNVVLTAGDMVFKLLTNSTPLGVATLRQFGECIISSSDPAVGLQIASPLVIQVTGTLACAVNNVTVRH